MPLFWFLAGVLTTLAALIVILPWLRTMPRLGALPSLPWQASMGAAVTVAAILGLYLWLGHPNGELPTAARASTNAPKGSNKTAGASGDAASTFGDAARAFGGATSISGNAANISGDATGAATSPGAGSMDRAIASLESRLAKGGGSADDWELLAKSFEFLARPADAAKARARQLPALKSEAGAAAPAAGSGTAISGEVTLDAALRNKAVAGETLFIVAKSVDAPGIPVAVLRGSVGSWPLKFTLDDSQSMLPGRNLSSAGRITIEARISSKGQPLPASGDLQGSTGIINPTDRQPLKIVIDRVIT